MTDTRTRILQAGAALFRENRYAPISTADILARAGLTNGLLFHAFENKAAIRDAPVGDARRSHAEMVVQRVKVAGLGRRDLALALIEGHLAWVDAKAAVAGLVYGLAPAVWEFDGEGQPPSALVVVLTALVQHMRQLNLGPLSGSALIALALGPTEMVSRHWLLGPRSGSLS